MIWSQSPRHDREQDGMVGCRTAVACRNQEFDATVYVRDINCAGFTAYGLAEDLSWLAAIREAARGIGIALPDSVSGFGSMSCSGRGPARSEPRR